MFDDMRWGRCCQYCIFFFNDTATTEIYTLSLHDALPICQVGEAHDPGSDLAVAHPGRHGRGGQAHDLLGLADGAHLLRAGLRSEEHTSELQSRQYLVCRLLLEKKKKQTITYNTMTTPKFM